MACPGRSLVAIWGLETDYGAGLGGYSTFSALATLAYECRRAQIYRAELIDALMLVQRGLLRPSQRGAWAGEIGQTQFMPSAYLKYAVNAHGGGGRRSDLQSRRRAGVDREFPALARLEPGRGLGRRPAEFQRLAAMELGRRSTPRRSLCSRTSWRARNSSAQRRAQALEPILICGCRRRPLWRGRPNWAMALPDRAEKPNITVVRHFAGKRSTCSRHRSRRLWTAR